MKRKIICILVIALLIATTALPVVGTINVDKNQEMDSSDEPEGFQKPSRRLSKPLLLPPFILQLVNGDWDYWSSPPNMFTIPDGNVGIGTSNPTSELEVVGNVEADSYTINGVPVGTSTDSYWLEGEEGDIYYNGDVEIKGILSVTGGIDPPYVVFDPLPNSQYPHQPPLNPVEGTVYYKAADDELYVYKIPDGWVQLTGGADDDWLDLGGNPPTNTGDIYHEDGNVGIGTTSPYCKLTVQDPTYPYISIRSDPSSAIRATLELAVATQTGFFSNVATPGDVIIRTPGGDSEDLILAARNGNNGAIRFTTGKADTTPAGESEKMTLINNGYLGIGTTNPTSKLHVNGPVATAIKKVICPPDYLITEDDSVIFAMVDSNYLSGIVYLPPINTCPGREYTIKNIDPNAGTIYVATSGGNVITCKDYPEINVEPCESIIVVNDGDQHWYIVADYK